MPATHEFYADDLAYVHHTGFADLARGSAPFIIDLLRSRGRTGGHVVDLGCGSGIVVRALADAGFTTTGVDLSPAMIAIAARESPTTTLHTGSLYDVTLPAADAILVIGEPLNYLERDASGRTRAPPLAPFFKKVARALSPGGLLVFDVIVDGPGPSLTRSGFRSGPGFTVCVETLENDARTLLTRDITTFVSTHGDDGPFMRTRELHTVRVLKTRELKSMLESAGFRVVVQKSYGPHPLALRRRAFVCTKR
jgi:SAM-dependent methyltransferase